MIGKKLQIKPKKFHFYLQIDFYSMFSIENKVLSDRSEMGLSNETIRIKKKILSVESYHEKITEKYRNCSIAEKRIVSKL